MNCPFCQEELFFKDHIHGSTSSWRCPNNHYDYCNLTTINEECYQESFFFSDFKLIVNNPDPDEFVILLYNKEKKTHPDEIKVHQLLHIKPFIIPYDYESLKSKIETYITFR